MHDNLLPRTLTLFCHPIYFLLILMALRNVDWKKILNESQTQHVFLGACVFIMMLWSMRAGITPGLNLHFLGTTVLTLVLGWPLAILASALALLADTFFGYGSWDEFSFNGLFLAAIPILTIHTIYRLVDRYLPQHIMIYILVTAFFGTLLTMFLRTTLFALAITLSSTYTFDLLSYEYLPYMLVLAFPEALLNGMLVTVLVLWRPEWVSTFDDRKYLLNK